LLEVRKSASELELLLLAARATVPDEAALMAAPTEPSQDGLQGHLANFDDWVASLSTQGKRDFARDALLSRLSEIFVDCDATRDIDRLVLQLFRLLEAESSLAARRACWVESIPLRPLLSAAEQRIERHSVLCGVLEQQQALLSQVERELLAAELVMAPATQEQIRAKVCEIKVAKTALETAIMYDLPDARAIEKKVANAERDGETSVTLGRNGSETLGIAEAKQRAQELRAAVRKASKAVDSASSELASEVNAFPELIVNICGPEVVLPADLVSLWRTGWTLESIEDVKLISTPSDANHPSRSIIYRGRITSLSGQQIAVAVKEYKLQRSALPACLREAALLHRAKHPHLVELLGLFMDPEAEAFYIVMPLYALGQLDEWVERCQPDQTSLRRVLMQVLSALVHLHSHRILHNDIKPANILISAEGTARLADLGVSQEMSTRISAVYRASRVGYTMGFDAPELTRTGGSEKADMYAFGATIKAVAVEGSDDLVRLLCHAQPEKRPTAVEAMQHPFFLPVFQWAKDERRTCCVSAFCESTNIPLAHGVECSRSGVAHFVCSMCFEQLVKTAAQEDLRIVQIREGAIPCPSCTTEGQIVLYTDADVAKNVSPEAFAAYNTMRMKLVEERMARDFDEQLKLRLTEELRRLAEMDEEQRKVRQACQHIAEDLLTLKCPRRNCRQAFVDFKKTDCLALRCSRCSCHFCGWCGADCGADAHPHVRECPHKLSGDPYYASVAEVKEVWRRIKSQKVKAFLASLDAKTASAVCQQMRQVLGELGIDNKTATADASRGAVEEAKQKQAEDDDDDSDEDDSDDDDDDDDDESNNEDQSDEDDEDDNEDDGM
jgi:hypothetical protein